MAPRRIWIKRVADRHLPVWHAHISTLKSATDLKGVTFGADLGADVSASQLRHDEGIGVYLKACAILAVFAALAPSLRGRIPGPQKLTLTAVAL